MAKRPPLPPRAAAALSGASLLILAFAPAQYLGRQQDDLLYLLGAESLWTGRYALLTMVGEPPLANTAPGWPLLLSPVSLLFDAPAAFQAFSALVLAASPWAAWAWARRRLDENAALLVALLCASSPLALAQAGTLMPEPAYLLVFLAALAASESGRAARSGAWAALAVLVRPAGLSALPALTAAAAKKRGPKGAALALVPPLAAAAAWSAWSWARSGGVQEASELAVSYGGGASALAVALDNARFLAASLGGSFLPPAWADGRLAALLGVWLLLCAAAGLKKALEKDQADPAALALLGAALMHALWTWRYERYWIPLLPLALWAAANAWGRRAAACLGGLLALQLAFQTLPRLGRPSPWAEPELAGSYAWLRAAPEPGALASALPARDGWHAGRPCLPLPVAEDGAEFAASLKKAGARFVLRQDGLDLGLSADANAPVRRRLDRAFAQLEDPRRFRLRHEEPAERARIYEPL